VWSCGHDRCQCGHIDGVLCLLGNPLPRKRKLHLGRDCSNEGIQCPSILVVVDIAIPSCFPDVPNLESYPHQRDPLNVVGLDEGRPPGAGIDVPSNGLDPAVNMVPIQGGRVLPPVEVTISIDPTATTGSTSVRSCLSGLASCAFSPGASSARLHLSGLPSLAPWGCVAALCVVCSCAACLASLSSSLVLPCQK
jgi:hypothetical protein